jgi:hypothetical protein
MSKIITLFSPSRSCSSFCVCICTFLLVKQVKWVPYSRPPAAQTPSSGLVTLGAPPLCTSKASKTSTLSEPSRSCSSFCVCICTFVLAKRVKRVPYSRPPASAAPSVSVFVLLYFCTSKASKTSTLFSPSRFCSSFCVCICTFVLVKWVKRVPYRSPPVAQTPWPSSGPATLGATPRAAARMRAGSSSPA